jgi:hypothetical protein
LNQTQYLMDLGKRYTLENKPDCLVCAFAGGSVGRGDADQYSDLDLNFYLSTPNLEHFSRNIEYHGHIIQLDVHAFPTFEEIIAHPWNYRFLREARSVYDPHNMLEELIAAAAHFFHSPQGQKLMIRQAVEIIGQRKAWLTQSLDNNEWITAGIAANCAFTDAAFAYAFFKHDSLSTGGLLSIIRGLDLYSKYREIRFEEQNITPHELLKSLKSYRTYLSKLEKDNFGLEAIQDILAGKKVQRLQDSNDCENIAWQLSGEAFWCYLHSSRGQSFEQHYNELDEKMKINLNNLGFYPYSKHKIDVIAELTEQLVEIIMKGDKN